MSIVSVKDIKKEIAYHKSQLTALNKLLDIAKTLDGGRKVSVKPAGTKKPAGRPGKRKRGAVSAGIISILGRSGKPMSSGDIRKAMVEKKLAKKSSTSIYSTLLQMANRGVIKKIKTAKGQGYTVKK